MEKIKVLMVMTDSTSVGHFRIGWPATYLQSIDSDIEVTLRLSSDVNPFDFVGLSKYDIIHFNRIFGMLESIEEIRAGLNKVGVKLVMDQDDHWELPDEFPLKKARQDIGQYESEIEFLKHVDHVTTTTRYLKEEIEQFNKNVTVLPNGVDLTHPMWQYEPVESDICRIGWLGSIQRHHDLLRMKESIERIYLDPLLKGKFQFVQVGGEEKDNEIFQGPNFVYYPGVSAGEYGKFYQKVDVCLAPLKENMYNLCKSELKMVEAGMMKKAFVCQDYGIYPDHISDPVNGILIKNDHQWYSAIKDLILMKSLRTSMGENLHKHMVNTFSLENVSKKRIEFYKNVADERMV